MKNNFKARIVLHIVVCAVCIFYTQVSLADSHSMNLDQVVSEALGTNPEFTSILNTERSVETQLDQARALYKPSVDITADTGYEQTETPVIDRETLFRNQASLSISQLVYDGAATLNQIDRQKSLLKAARFRTNEAAQLVSLNITNAYLNVLRANSLLDIAEANLEDHMKILARIDDGARNGRFNQGDLAQIEARVALAEANLETVRQNQIQARAAYMQATNNTAPEELEMPQFNASYLPETVDEFIRYARENSPTLASFRSEVTAADEDYDSAKGSFLPNLNLEVTGTKGEDLGGIEGSETLASALLVMRWNVYRGGADKARLKEQYFQRSIAEDELNNALRTLMNDIKNIWASRDATANQIETFMRQSEANEKLVRIYQEQFDLGRRSLLDLLDTRNALFTSENSKINAVFNTLFASYQLLALSGDLTKQLGIGNVRELYREPTAEFKPFSLISSPFAASPDPDAPKDGTPGTVGKDKDIIPSPDAVLAEGPQNFHSISGPFDAIDAANTYWEKVIDTDPFSDTEYFIEEANTAEFYLVFGATDEVTATSLCANLLKNRSEVCTIVTR